MKKWKYFCILLVIPLLSGAWVYRYRTLNQHYDELSNVAEETFEVGSEIAFGEDYIDYGLTADGYLICIDKFEMLDYETFAEAYNSGYKSTGKVPDKLALISITLKNQGSNDKGVPLAEIELFGLDELIFMDYELLLILNPVLQGNLGISLADNTEYTLLLPYGLYQEDFSQDTWEHIDQYDMYLQITTHPVRKVVILD